MRRLLGSGMIGIALLLSIAVGASAAGLVVPKGTRVILAFDQAVSSETAWVGQRIRLRVKDDVVVNGQRVIQSGAPVEGVISKVKKRKSYGRNAEMRIILQPVQSAPGVRVPLEASEEGTEVRGRKSAEAAGATVGGAAVLGPVGLVGGYFVKGKPVEVKPGDALVTEVPKRVVLKSGQTEPTGRHARAKARHAPKA